MNSKIKGYQHTYSRPSPAPKKLNWTTIMILFWAVAIVTMVALLFGGAISRKVTVVGILTSTHNIEVKATKSGIVSQLFVRDNERVKLNQPLMEISTDQETSTGTIGSQILSLMKDQISSLQTELTAGKITDQLDVINLRERIATERAQLKLLQDAVPTQERKLKIAQETLERGQQLSQSQAISRLQLQQFETAALDQQQNISELRLRMQQLDGELKQDEVRLVQLPHRQSQTQSELVAKIASLQESIVTTEGSKSYYVTAKEAGTITLLQVRRGQQVNPMQQLMEIVSRDSDLYAQAYVPSRAIAFVKRGQTVRLMYDAFPFQKFGSGGGTIHSVSSTILTPSEISEAVAISEPVYSVKISLSKKSITSFGVETPLQPGMAFTADIALARQSFAELLFDPLLAAGKRF